MTYLVVAAFVAILGALAAAGVFMMRGGKGKESNSGHPNSGMANALALRVGLSIALFAVILFSYWMGWIQPTGIPPGK